MSSGIAKQLIVFDFDWSLVDQDTDHWVFEALAPQLCRKIRTLAEEVQWTDLIAKSLVELHESGGTREQIEDALRVLPFHPAMIRAVQRLNTVSTPQTAFLILSDSNSIFISTILEHRGLAPLFQEIITNPAEWDPSGLLKLRRRVDPSGPQHNCNVGCNPNMCKGEELEAFLARQPTGFDRIMYVGDGSNDFCPVLRLRRQDCALVRKYRGLEKRIAAEGRQRGLQCKTQYWAGAWEVEEIFSNL